MVKKYFLLLFLISSQFIFAQTAKVNASTDTSDYLIGDPIHFKIRIEVGKEFIVSQPAVKDTIGGLEILSTFEPGSEISENNKVITFKYLLAGYDSLQVVIPPIEIVISKTSDTTKISTFTNSIELRVHKVEIDPGEDIKDVKEPIRIPLDWKIIALWITGAAIIIVLAVYLYNRYKRKKAGEVIEEEIVLLPPDVTAIGELKQLEIKKLWQNGKVKEYHSDITGIIRKYFEGRFYFPALELTTSEVMDKLSKVEGGENIKALTSDFLNNADLVKFAKYKPMDVINLEMMQQAYKIVEDTRIVIKTSEELSSVQ